MMLMNGLREDLGSHALNSLAIILLSLIVSTKMTARGLESLSESNLSQNAFGETANSPIPRSMTELISGWLRLSTPSCLHRAG
jgi:hypothetical protein